MDRGYIKQSIKKLISIIEQKLNQTFIITKLYMKSSATVTKQQQNKRQHKNKNYNNL